MSFASQDIKNTHSLGDGLVIPSQNSGSLLMLDAAEKSIWDAFCAGHKSDEIADYLTAIYGQCSNRDQRINQIGVEFLLPSESCAYYYAGCQSSLLLIEDADLQALIQASLLGLKIEPLQRVDQLVKVQLSVDAPIGEKEYTVLVNGQVRNVFSGKLAAAHLIIKLIAGRAESPVLATAIGRDKCTIYIDMRGPDEALAHRLMVELLASGYQFNGAVTFQPGIGKFQQSAALLEFPGDEKLKLEKVYPGLAATQSFPLGGVEVSYFAPPIASNEMSDNASKHVWINIAEIKGIKPMAGVDVMMGLLMQDVRLRASLQTQVLADWIGEAVCYQVSASDIRDRPGSLVEKLREVFAYV